MNLHKPNEYFTHKCGRIDKKDLGQHVVISGWCANRRDHGSLLFLDIRDSTGLVQCVIEEGEPAFNLCSEVPIESVVRIKGKVHARLAGTENIEMSSGYIEIRVDSIEVMSEAETMPFQLFQENLGEEQRLRWRFLDLRREEMQERLRLRANVVKILRREMEDLGFMEVHTPLLTVTSPEGARDYAVPSRLHPGKFYVLPQSPQQFKQLLMVGGVDRYYQIAPCFRDEDPRADRAPGAFYQLDLEMAFTTQNEVLDVVEKVLWKTFTELSNFKITSLPFPRITYKDSMQKYATDKPDMRNPLEYIDVTEYFRHNPPNVFKDIINSGGYIYMLPAPDLLEMPRSFFDQMNKEAVNLEAKGLGYVLKIGDDFKGPMVNILPEKLREFLGKDIKIDHENRELVAEGFFFIAHSDIDQLRKIAAPMRNIIAKALDLIDDLSYRFCWIVDFPMYEKNDNGGWDFSHNPFSMPQGGMDALNGDPGEVLGWQYDIVCNGHELSSGAVRNHKPEIMYKAFEIAGYSRETVKEKFSAMINAFSYGAPPHAGCAPGIDRIVMLLANVKNLREVIPFPLNPRAMDLMMGAPSELTPAQLKELRIQIMPEED